jgi:hypothetical protein
MFAILRLFSTLHSAAERADGESFEGPVIDELDDGGETPAPMAVRFPLAHPPPGGVAAEVSPHHDGDVRVREHRHRQDANGC